MLNTTHARARLALGADGWAIVNDDPATRSRQQAADAHAREQRRTTRPAPPADARMDDLTARVTAAAEAKRVRDRARLTAAMADVHMPARAAEDLADVARSRIKAPPEADPRTIDARDNRAPRMWRHGLHAGEWRTTLAPATTTRRTTPVTPKEADARRVQLRCAAILARADMLADWVVSVQDRHTALVESDDPCTHYGTATPGRPRPRLRRGDRAAHVAIIRDDLHTTMKAIAVESLPVRETATDARRAVNTARDTTARKIRESHETDDQARARKAAAIARAEASNARKAAARASETPEQTAERKARAAAAVARHRARKKAAAPA